MLISTPPSVDSINGKTGDVTLAASDVDAIPVASPSDGDILYAQSGTWHHLAHGTSSQVLTSNGTSPPSWSAAGGAVSSVNGHTGTVVLTSTDTGSIPVNSPSDGDILYASGGTWHKLAHGTTGQVLQTNGTSAPSWVTPAGGSSGPTRPSVAAAIYAWSCDGNPTSFAADGTAGNGGGAYAIVPGSTVKYNGSGKLTAAGLAPYYPNDGTNNGISVTGSVPAVSDLSNFTIECVFSTNTFRNTAHIIRVPSNNPSFAAASINIAANTASSTIYTTTGGFLNNINGYQLISTDKLYHICMRWQNGQYQDLFIDGTVRAHYALGSPGYQSDWQTNVAIEIGGNADTLYLDGGVKWIAIHATALTNAQILARAATALGWPNP